MAATWSAEEIARRWLMLGKATVTEERVAAIAADAARIAVLRRQLSDLSWFMRMLNEHIAKRANKEDRVTGHFWNRPSLCRLPPCLTRSNLSLSLSG